MVGGPRCTSEEQIKEQADQSHCTDCISYIYKDNEGGIHKGVKSHIAALKWKEDTIISLALVIKISQYSTLNKIFSTQPSHWSD